MLGRYARLFPVVEIDSTYYGLPTARTVETWARTTPDGFRFSAKLPRAGTHLDPTMLGFVHGSSLVLGSFGLSVLGITTSPPPAATDEDAEGVDG